MMEIFLDDCDDHNGTTIEQVKNRFAKCDPAFTEPYNSIVDKVYQSKQNDSVERVIQDLIHINLDVRDHPQHEIPNLRIFNSCVKKHKYKASSLRTSSAFRKDA